MAPRRRQIRAVVFDLDGTLCRERDYVRSGYRAVAEAVRRRTGRRTAYEDWMWRRFLSGKRTHTFDAIACEETRDGQTHFFAWITNIHVDAKSVDAIATQGGRGRWTIENQGFNAQKNSDLNLEHPYSTDPEKMKAYYYLLQIAHIILQLLEMGSLLARIARAHGKTALGLFGSLKRIARRLLECFRYYRLPDEAYAVGTAIRIRLDTS